jgi:hypothetical protein
MSPPRARLVPFALAFGLTLAALGSAILGTARAEATVQVEVRPPVDGTVTITPNAPGSRSFSCHTRAGVCTIAGVPGGLATVRFAPDGGGAQPSPHTVMIAPSGNVRLTVPSAG